MGGRADKWERGKDGREEAGIHQAMKKQVERQGMAEKGVAFLTEELGKASLW